MNRRNVGLLMVVILFGSSVSAWAQQGTIQDRTYGTASAVVQMIGAFAFTGLNATDTANLGSTSIGARYCMAAAGCSFEAAVSLPAGAVVTSIDLDACIFSLGSMEAKLVRFASNELSSGEIAVASTIGPDIVGCGDFPSSENHPEAIDNRKNYYILQVQTTGDGTSSTRFHGVRINYHLQVSPAPATATFNDVPTNHPFFPFVQALVAAGITSGCNASPPLYCPDTPVTRGQMAKFLSTALGLHFAP